MDRYRCKLCFRDFASGKALGGHVRSHGRSFCKEKAGFKRGREENPCRDMDDFPSGGSVSWSSSQSSWERDGGEAAGEEVAERVSREMNRKRSCSVVFAGPAPELSSAVVHDGESETESWKRTSIRHSSLSDYSGSGGGGNSASATTSNYYNNKRYCSSAEPLISSISDTTPDEDGAHCLMMLSRDQWKREEKEEKKEEKGKEFADDYSEDSYVTKVKRAKVHGGRYRCKPCNKLFRSYQALGGHRASHKKLVKAVLAPPSSHDSTAAEAAEEVEEKVYSCPFCDRVFSSGQALGGHKRSHFAVNGGISSRNICHSSKLSSSRNGGSLKIDLNLPAPVEDEDSEIIASVNIKFSR